MEIGRYLPLPGAIIVSILLCVFLFWFTEHNSSITISQNPPSMADGIPADRQESHKRSPYSFILSLAEIFLSPKNRSSNSSVSVDQKDDVSSLDYSNSSGDKKSADLNCGVSKSFPARVQKWCNLITKYASKNNLDPDLVAALIWQESGGNDQAYSHSGAVGLMQVMPKDGIAATFRCPNGPCFQNRPTIKQLKDPEFNLSFGTKMLAGLIKRKGSLREGLKFYGPADTGYYYADKVMSIYKQYKD